jgi:hypothetical protein
MIEDLHSFAMTYLNGPDVETTGIRSLAQVDSGGRGHSKRHCIRVNNRESNCVRQQVEHIILNI